MQAIKRVLVALLVASFAAAAFCKSKVGHQRDIIDCLFNSQNNDITKELADFISQGMDMGSGSIPVDLSEKGSAYANTVKNSIYSVFEEKLRGTGPHRTLGHWNFDGNIPGEYLEVINDLEVNGKTPVGSQKIFVDSWREFVASRTEAVKQVFNLSGPNSDRAARSFAAMCSDIHSLGDWTTTDWRGLRTLDQIVDDYCRSGNRILGRNNGLTKVIKADVRKILAKCDDMEVMKEFRKIPQHLTDAEKAAEVIRFAEKMSDGEFLQIIKINTKGLKGDARVKEILSLPKKYARHKVAGEVIDALKYRNDDFYARIGRVFGRLGFDGNWKSIDWGKLKSNITMWRIEKNIGSAIVHNTVNAAEKMDPTLTKSVAAKIVKDVKAQCRDAKLAKGFIPETMKPQKGYLVPVTYKSGRKSYVLLLKSSAVRATSGAVAGAVEGVCAFVISSGIAFAMYQYDAIDDEELKEEFAKAAMSAAVVGTIVAVTVVLGASPYGFTVIAVGIAGYVVCDMVFTMIKQQTFTCDDILGYMDEDFERTMSFLTLGTQPTDTFINKKGKDSFVDEPEAPTFIDFGPKGKSFMDLLN